MSPDVTSLELLRDIVQPPPVSWWPPAVGWWIVLAILSTALAVRAARGWRRWLQNRYRRVALQAIAEATTVSEIADVLKRTALVAYGRSDVARLTGPRWYRRLGDTCGREPSAQVVSLLGRGVYNNDDVADISELRAYAVQWVERHRERGATGVHRDESLKAS